MSHKAVHPSAYLPDYLRQDLKIGEPDAHPLAAALDEVFTKWFLLAQKSAHSLVPQAWSEERCEEALEYHGFQTKFLTPEMRRLLFRALPRLFALKGEVASIESLASFYFGLVQVQRGRHEQAQGLAERTQLPLRATDLGARDRLLIVRIPREASREEIAEFIANAKRLLPDTFEVTVAANLAEPSTERREMQVGKGIRLERRRL